MSITTAFMLQPNIWTVIAPLPKLHMLQVKDPKNVRLHFGDIRHFPDIDTEDYILTKGYDPTATVLVDNFRYYNEAALFARPDGSSAVKIVAVMLKSLSPIMLPEAGTLVAEKVGEDVWRQFSVLSGSEAIRYMRFAVTDGAIPTGLELKPKGELMGIPTAAGDFAFEITGTHDRGALIASYTMRVNA